MFSIWMIPSTRTYLIDTHRERSTFIAWDHRKNSFLFKIAQSKWIKSRYLFIYLLLAEVLDVGVFEVHEGVLEGSDQHGTILKQFLIQNCTCKMIKSWYLFRFLLIAEVLEVGVVEVHEGAPEPSDPSGELLNLNPIRNCTRNKLSFFSCLEATCPPHLGWLCRRLWGCPWWSRG